MTSSRPAIEPVSEDSLLIRLGERIDEKRLPELLGLQKCIKQEFADTVLDIVPSYTTLLVRYDLDKIDFRLFLPAMKKVVESTLQGSNSPINGDIHHVPVWYDPLVGPDLNDLALRHNLSIDRIVELHTARCYRVYAMGFIPGFGFLGQVDQRLVTPRHESPRDCVPAGSVGIANNQTAVYPRNSPGGWQIIGKSPHILFNQNKPLESAALFRVGDTVHFYAIDRNRFHELGGQL